MPDLPILTASLPLRLIGQEPAPSPPAQFVECTPPAPDIHDILGSPPLADDDHDTRSAPRLTPGDYKDWADAVQKVTQFIANGGSLYQPHLAKA